MKSSGVVFQGRNYIGSAEPPATVLEDESRFGNDMAFVSDGNPDWVQLPNGLWVMSFDGSDIVTKTIANWRGADSKGTILVWAYTDVEADQGFFASCDEGGTAYYFRFGLTAPGGGFLYLFFDQRNSDTRCAVVGDTNVFTVPAWRLYTLTSSGTAWKLYVNKNLEGLTVTSANNGDWFADTLNRDNFTIGAYKRSSTSAYMNGLIAPPRVLNYELSLEQIAAYHQETRHRFGV